MKYLVAFVFFLTGCSIDGIGDYYSVKNLSKDTIIEFNSDKPLKVTDEIVNYLFTNLLPPQADIVMPCSTLTLTTIGYPKRRFAFLLDTTKCYHYVFNVSKLLKQKALNIDTLSIKKDMIKCYLKISEREIAKQGWILTYDGENLK
jgi:hypothetical protein